MVDVSVALVGKGKAPDTDWAVGCSFERTMHARHIGPQASNCRAAWFAVEFALDVAPRPCRVLHCSTDVCEQWIGHFRDRDVDVMARVAAKRGGASLVFTHRRDIPAFGLARTAALESLPRPVWSPNDAETDRAVRAAMAAKHARRSDFWAVYSQYLESQAWASRRAVIRARSNGRCEQCGGLGEHVHHLTYARVFAEYPQDLVLLCFQCHDEAHNGKLSRGVK